MKEPQPLRPPLDTRDGTPLCLVCVRPVTPIQKVCEHCGSAVGQLTPYLPWERIRWEAQAWGRMWDQVWERNRSLPGRLFRFALLTFFFPFLLVFAAPKLLRLRAAGAE